MIGLVVFNIEIKAVDNSITKRSGLGRSGPKILPKCVCKRTCLSVRLKTRAFECSSKGEKNNLALCLACLDVFADLRTAEKIGSGEGRSPACISKVDFRRATTSKESREE